MTFLAHEIALEDKKVLYVDDEVAPQELQRHIFSMKTGISFENLFFADSFSSALELLEECLDISIVIVDLRIPEKSKDRSDYNPKNPGKEWGKVLIEEITSKYSNKRSLDIVVVSAYTTYDQSSQDASPILAFLEKPIKYDRLAKNLETIIDRETVYGYDYSSLDEDLSRSIKQKTRSIKKDIEEIQIASKLTITKVIDIGKKLFEVQKDLGHGNFTPWLEAEFAWDTRTANRYMSVVKRFKSDSLSDLKNLLPSALYQLAPESVPEEAVIEAKRRARQGEVLGEKAAKEIKAKYKKLNKQVEIKVEAENSPKELPSFSKSQYLTLPEKQTARPKQKILSVVPSQNAVKNSWWQLGEHNRLFCGEPKNKDFIKSLPKDIALKISFPPGEDYSLIPSVRAIASYSYHSQYSDLDIDDLVAEAIKTSTKPNEMVLFNYIYYAELLELVEKFQCYFWVAEPDLNKCQEILTIWREKGKVERIIA